LYHHELIYLGIVTNEISLPREIGAQLEPSQEEGLIILSVEKDSAAKKAGLLMGDIIVRLDDQHITNIHDPGNSGGPLMQKVRL